MLIILYIYNGLFVYNYIFTIICHIFNVLIYIYCKVIALSFCIYLTLVPVDSVSDHCFYHSCFVNTVLSIFDRPSVAVESMPVKQDSILLKVRYCAICE